MSESAQFQLQLRLISGYKFEIDFGGAGQIFSDEPSPLGEDSGPNPTRLLGAAVANCLAASLLFAVRKFKEDPGPVSATVQGEIARQDGRWRVANIHVELTLGNAAEAMPHLERALSQFENFCVVTQSVRQGIDVAVQVRDNTGTLLHNS